MLIRVNCDTEVVLTIVYVHETVGAVWPDSATRINIDLNTELLFLCSHPEPSLALSQSLKSSYVVGEFS